MTRQLRMVCLALSVAWIFGVSTVRAAAQNGSPQQPKNSIARPAQMESDQMTNIPYFTVRDGMSSTLTLNNLAPTPTKVTVTIFNTKGQAHVLDAMTLDPHSFREVRLQDVVPPGDFASGNIQVAFRGIPMVVTCQVSVSSLEKRVSFESREQDMMDFMSSSMNGIAWLPQAEADGFLAVTNAAKSRVTVQLTVGSNKKDISLFPRETQVLKLKEELGLHAPVAAVVKLQHNGLPGDIITTGYVLNLKDGYSSSFAMLDPSIMRSSHLAGAHFRFGQPDPSEGFPAGTEFRSPLLLANISDKPITAHVSVDYTVQEKAQMTPIDPKNAGATQEKFSTAKVEDLTIAPGEVHRIELSDALGGVGLVEEAGVDIAYDAAPGSIIGQLTSVDQTGDYAFEVPVKDPDAMNEMMESIYPWTLEGGTRTVLHLKNTTDQAVQAWTTFAFAGGTYNLPLLSFQPYQTIAIDIQALKDSKKPDARGIPFPADATHGQAVWFPKTPYSLVGRAEQTNVSEGIARSFSCSDECCNSFQEEVCVSTAPCAPNYSPPPGPAVSGLTGVVGGNGQLNVYNYGWDCFGYRLGPSLTSASYGSSWTYNSSVASVNSSGNVSYIGTGSTTVGLTNQSIAFYDWDLYLHCHNVGASYTTASNEQAPVQVRPVISGLDTVWYFGGQSPSGYATSITLTSSGGTATTWSVTAGANMVSLSTTTGSQTTVTSSGTAFSSSVGDIGIQATAGGVASAVFSITSRKPYFMAPNTGLYLAGCPDSSQGYLSKVFYTIEDQLFAVLPANVPQNEFWTSTQQNDYPGGSNWVQNTAVGSVVGPVNWFDIIGAYTGTGAMPVVNCSGPHTAVVHWGQQWRFGNTMSGQGQLVQADTLQKYLDDANHTNVMSPQ